jgi:transposase
MTRAYSNDLRSRVMREVKKGATCRSVANIFGVAPSTVVKWAQRMRKTGHYDAMPQGGDRRSRLKEERQWLLQQIKEFPDATLTELQDALAQRGIRVGYGTVWRFFDREGISFKKKSLRRGAKTR